MRLQSSEYIQSAFLHESMVDFDIRYIVTLGVGSKSSFFYCIAFAFFLRYLLAVIPQNSYNGSDDRGARTDEML